ncbi:MAG: phosphotransferase family protein, partial [Actinomycetota bacterium]
GGVVVEKHEAGFSNETFYVSWGPKRWVLRRPPRGDILPTAHDMLREFRVLSGLTPTGVRVPRPVVACEDRSIIGVPFYLMERMEGVVIRDRLPGWTGPEERRRIGQELVDALAELHAFDWRAAGLEGWGRPTGYLERQLRRWTGQLQLTVRLTRPLPDLFAVGRWLEENLPGSPPAVIVHGDYKLDNVVLAPEPPARIAAILDWEMSTIGDPRADLGYLLSFWREPDDPVDDLADQFGPTRQPGFLSRAELVERYAERTGRHPGDLTWYQVLATWKLAILLEGSYARHLAGVTDDPFFTRLKDGVPALAGRAVAEAGIA